MSSQNEVNEEGTMVNTQTPITQTPEPQTPQTQTQKRIPRGITTMKSVVRARSNNKGDKLTVEWNAMGQPLNNKGGNTLVSYIGVVVRQNISIKFKHWSDDRLNGTKDIIWKDITVSFHAICNVNLKPPAKYANLIDEADWIEFVNYRTKDGKFLKISEQNRKRASHPIYSYRASRMGYRGVEEKIVSIVNSYLEQSETPSSATVDLDVLWVDGWKNKQCVVDNEKVQEA
ncbi:hypothetical protein Lal_00030075, partial [Lupinus albus]